MTIEYKDSKRLSGLSSDSTGLKAYWKMNDLSGKLLNTASSQGNTALSGSDLTISGTTGYGATGHIYPVYSYSFTNADGNKAVADNSASDWNFLTNSGNKFTITLWLKIKSNSINADFMGTGGTGSNDFAIRYRGAVADNKFAIFFSNEGEKITSTSTTLTDTNWHFYMIQYDDSVGTLRFQKDAVAVEEFTGLNLTSTGNPTTALGFGDSNGSTSETGGDMQEVTVWDRVLTTAEIAQIYNTGSGAELQNTTIPFGGRPTNVQVGSRFEETDTRKMYHKVDVTGADLSLTGLKAYYKFDSTDSNVLVNKATVVGSTDSLGTGADGANTGVTLDTTNAKLGSGCYNFDGSGDKVILGSTSTLDFLGNGSDWTMSFWMKLNAIEPDANVCICCSGQGGIAPGMDILFDDRSAENRDHAMGIRMENNIGYTPALLYTGAQFIPKDTNWHHYIITLDASARTFTAYRDGANSVSNSSGSGSFSAPARAQQLGTYPGSGFGDLNGKLDDYSIWNRVLTSTEIATIYNSGSGKLINTDTWSEEGT